MPSVLRLGALALTVSPVVVAATTYNLMHTFDATNFFQNFSLTAGSDPTHGFVDYLDYDKAQSAGLAGVKAGNVYLGVDNTNKYTSGGRPSTRAESNGYFGQGLLVADLAHMPGGACGVWPAFWTVGANWPADGEIDLIEGVNKQVTNGMVLHTQGECDITSTAQTQTGNITAPKCALSAGTTGCVIEGTQGSYGDAFNALGGGVYAMEWTSQFIKIWFFPRNAIPQSITAGKADPSEFGTPMGDFQGSCNIGDEFQPQRIIFNTDFCGDWAGGVFASADCPMSDASSPMDSCNAYVGANPSAFRDAYWEIKSIQIYEQGSPSTPSATATAATTAATTTSIKTAEPTTTTTLSSTSTRTVTQTLERSTPSESASTPCPPKSIVTVTSFTTPAATASSKLTTTTIATTSYVDVCPSGYTTKTIVHTVTYCPADTTSGGVPPGFKTTSKLCTSGCGTGPATVLVTVPTGAHSTVAATTTGVEPTLSAPGSIVVPPISRHVLGPSPSRRPTPSPSSSIAVSPVATATPTPGSGTTTAVMPTFTAAGSITRPCALAYGLVVFICFIL